MYRREDVVGGIQRTGGVHGAVRPGVTGTGQVELRRANVDRRRVQVVPVVDGEGVGAGLVEEVDGVLDSLVILAGEADDERGVGEDVALAQLFDAESVVVDRGPLVHVAQHAVIAGLDAQQHPPASGVVHQVVDARLLGMPTAKVREPFDAEVTPDHHPAQLLEPAHWHVEGVVDERQPGDPHRR